MKATFHLGWVTAASLLAVNTAGEGTLAVSSGSPSRQILLSVPVGDRLATQEPRAPDLASALWVVTPLPITVPARYGYYGTARSLNDRGDVLGNDLSQMKHVSSGGVVTDLGIYRFHYNSGRQLDTSGRLALNAAVGTDGLLLQLRDGLPPTETRFTDTRLTSVDNEGGLLGVALNLSRLTDQDYWGQHFLQRGTSRRDLPAPADSGFGADFVTLNERDEVAGSAYQIPREWWRGLYLKPGNDPRWLPGFGTYEEVYNMNTHGQIVGSSSVPAGFGYAPGMYPAFWENGGVGRIAILDTDRSLFGGEYGWAWAINRWGHVVGRTRSGGKLWLNGRPHDLTGKVINLENVRLDYFSDINDRGEIIGAEYAIGGTQGSRAFIMRPIWPSLAVDLNRDGIISLPSDGDKSDLTTPAMPYRFWINDDDDGNALNGEREVEGGGQRDCDTRGDFGLTSRRDLEDLFRLRFSYVGLEQQLANAGRIKVGLKWKSGTINGQPAVNLYRHCEDDSGTRYLSDRAVATLQITPPFSSTLKDTVDKDRVSHDAAAFMLSDDLFSGARQGASSLPLLIEGAAIGAGRLQVVFFDQNGLEICLGPAVDLSIDYIDTFFERVKATTNFGISANGVDYNIPFPHDYVPENPPLPVMGWAEDSRGRPYIPDLQGEDTHKEYMVFVHGWRQAPSVGIPAVSSSLTYARTMYKRLWHIGYRGRFAAFRWPTLYGGSNDGDDMLAGISTYNDSEYRAWKSGESLKQYVNQLPSDYSRTIVAHSMGNVVVGSAFNEGIRMKNYIMLNPAVPAIAYDARAPRHEPVLKGFYALVKNMESYLNPLTAITPNDDPDTNVKSKSYADRLTEIDARVINFYLAADSATLSSWNANNAALRPHLLLSPKDPGYSYNFYIDHAKLIIARSDTLGRFRNLEDPHEVMAYDCKSPTQTVNAEGASTNGRIIERVDMSGFDFGEEHSAQWQWPFQDTYKFYGTLREKIGFSP